MCWYCTKYLSVIWIQFDDSATTLKFYVKLLPKSHDCGLFHCCSGRISKLPVIYNDVLCYCCYHHHHHHHHHYLLLLLLLLLLLPLHHHLVKMWLSELATDVLWNVTCSNKIINIGEGTSHTAANYRLLISGVLKVTITCLQEVAYSAYVRGNFFFFGALVFFCNDYQNFPHRVVAHCVT